MDGSLRGTGREFHTPNFWMVPSKTRDLVLRETVFVHKEYNNHIQLIHGLTQAESNDLCAGSRFNSGQASRTHPRRNLKVIEETWELKTPRKRTCEHP